MDQYKKAMLDERKKVVYGFVGAAVVIHVLFILSRWVAYGVGVAGLLATDMAAHWDIKSPLYVAELALGAAEAEPPLPRFEPLPRYPAVVADMTIEHPLELSFAEMEGAVHELADGSV